MNSTPTRFDDALPAFVKGLARHLPPHVIVNGVVVRDMFGRLAFTSASSISDRALKRMNKDLEEAVGHYARPHGAVIVGVSDGKPVSILNDPGALKTWVSGMEIRLVDRRLSGGDWLREAKQAVEGAIADAVPTVVFASMKGGVGRSTALVVCALDLIRAGRRVLIVDLDIEAPGLGVMLLTDAELPRFGVIDALVERKLGPLDSDFLRDIVASSALASGALLVCPALGARSIANPANVLSKIGRAYGDAEDADGKRLTLMDQVSELVDGLKRIHGPDVVLVDARAGLHELTAATILGLGSEVLLFGLDEAQTWVAYRILLAQLAASSHRIDWSDALTPVQGKAPADVSKRATFKEKWRSLLASMTVRGSPLLSPKESLPGEQYEWDESTGIELELDERPCVTVLYNESFSAFAPLSPRMDGLDSKVYDATFGDLFEHVRRVVGLT
ncbi:MAG: P-loop NTPase [Myxococcales bacterium]|nr:P-loop NTPase [Myxococcales bacterium]